MNDKIGLISVIVPVYKVEKYLSRCIESILAQTYKNIEIIVVSGPAVNKKFLNVKNLGLPLSKKYHFSCYLYRYFIYSF